MFPAGSHVAVGKRQPLACQGSRRPAREGRERRVLVDEDHRPCEPPRSANEVGLVARDLGQRPGERAVLTDLLEYAAPSWLS